MIFSESEKPEPTETHDPMIPGLPDEIAEHCLLHLPYPYQNLVRSVSSSWNKAILNPHFLISKKTLSLSLPYLFVFAFHKSTAKIQWQSFDPRSRRWFVLPPMPCSKPVCPPGFACAANPRRGELFVIGGMRSDTESPLETLISYKASSNSWSYKSSMLTARSFFAAGSIGGKIYAAGGSGAGISDTISAVERYDPDEDKWAPVAKMRTGMTRYDAAVLKDKLYVTEGWTWPFSFSPRGIVYDAARDVWEDMSAGMRDGWTGVSVVLDGRLFAIAEFGDSRIKLYLPEMDTWQYVGGGGLPTVLQKPFVVSGIEGCIYVVSCGLDVAIGRVFGKMVGAKEELWVEWEVVAAPKVFADFAPSNSQVLYA